MYHIIRIYNFKLQDHHYSESIYDSQKLILSKLVTQLMYENQNTFNMKYAN